MPPKKAIQKPKSKTTQRVLRPRQTQKKQAPRKAAPKPEPKPKAQEDPETEAEWTKHYEATTETWCEVSKSSGKIRYSTPSSTEPPTPYTPDEYRKVYIVRSLGGGPVFKHWSLFISPFNPQRSTRSSRSMGTPPKKGSQGVILNIEGQRTKYRFVERKGNPLVGVGAGAERVVDWYAVGYVDTEMVGELRRRAKAKRIKNSDQYWGCQDWTWEFVGEMEGEGILEYCEEFRRERKMIGGLKGAGK